MLLVASLVLGPSQARAQVVAVPVPIQGLDASGYKVIDQVTRDGSRIVVSIGAGPATTAAYTVVLDTGTGAPLFDSRPVATSQRPYTSVRLSPDGALLVDAANTGFGTVRVRHLDTGAESEVFREAFSDIAVRAVAEGASLVAAYSALGTSMGIPFKVGGATRPGSYFGSPCHPGFSERCPSEPLTMSADGRYLVYLFGLPSVMGYASSSGVMLADVQAGSTHVLDLHHPALASHLWAHDAQISGDGRWVGFTGTSMETNEPRAAMLDRRSGHVLLIAPSLGPTVLHGLSDDGRFVLVGGVYPYVNGNEPLRVVDRVSGLVTVIGKPLDLAWGNLLHDARLSGDGSTVVMTLWQPSRLLSFNRSAAIARLDADGDGLHDAWETTFGLNPADPTDAGLDPDGDGFTNAQEYDAGRHPRGTPVRYFAEGANGSFFATSLALFNPSDVSVTASVRFLGASGAVASTPITVPAQRPAYLEVDQANLPFTEFSIVVESPVPLVAERRMTWDRTSGYGMHSSTGVAEPAEQWHFAEGATIAGMQTFFLLQNPGDVAATVTMRYLLSTGVVHERVHEVPAQSRITVWTNQEGAPLDAAEFAATVVSDRPIVAERAMYRDAPWQVFGAGSVAAGVATPSLYWSFSEGATGPYFDTFLLLANPGVAPATVRTFYLRAGSSDALTGLGVTRTYTVAPGERRTIWVDQEDPLLADVALATILSSDVPIVAERAMWWPGPTASTWHGTHVETGQTEGAPLWAIADCEVGATTSVETFVTVGNSARLGALLRITVHLEDGRRLTRDISAGNRFTLWPRYDFPETVGQRFALTVESLPVLLSPSPSLPIGRPGLVVEKVQYRGGFAAGDVTRATGVPD